MIKSEFTKIAKQTKFFEIMEDQSDLDGAKVEWLELQTKCCNRWMRKMAMTNSENRDWADAVIMDLVRNRRSALQAKLKTLKGDK